MTAYFDELRNFGSAPACKDHAAAAIAKAGTSTVFAWKGETLPE